MPRSGQIRDLPHHAVSKQSNVAPPASSSALPVQSIGRIHDSPKLNSDANALRSCFESKIFIIGHDPGCHLRPAKPSLNFTIRSGIAGMLQYLGMVGANTPATDSRTLVTVGKPGFYKVV